MWLEEGKLQALISSIHIQNKVTKSNLRLERRGKDRPHSLSNLFNVSNVQDANHRHVWGVTSQIIKKGRGKQYILFAISTWRWGRVLSYCFRVKISLKSWLIWNKMGRELSTDLKIKKVGTFIPLAQCLSNLRSSGFKISSKILFL